MRLLVTRPEPDALKLRAVLEERGHEATVEPLLSVSFDDADPIDLEGVQALIATSRNAPARPEVASPARPRRASCRCSRSAGRRRHEARALGFETVVTGAGTAHELVAHIVSVVGARRPACSCISPATRWPATSGASSSCRASAWCSPSSTACSPPARSVGGYGRAAGDGGDRGRHPDVAAERRQIYAALMRKQGLASVARGLVHFCLSAGDCAASASRLGAVSTRDCRGARAWKKCLP